MKRNVLLIAFMAILMAGCHNGTKPVDNPEKKVETAETIFEDLTESINTRQDAQKSIELTNRLVAEYPDYENNAAALFMLANFVYDEQLGDLDKARETYQRIIDEYPDSPFANDAAIAITQLGIPLEDLVKMFEEQNP